MRYLRKATQLLGALGALAWLGGCEDNPPTGPGRRGIELLPSAVIVSDPVGTPTPSLAGRGDATAAPGGAESLVYVSLAPGTAARGSSVEIRNVATGFTRTGPLVAGGLDPVAMPARVDDVIELTVRDGAEVTARARVVVGPRRPPKVVRTDPPRGKRDVPLNARVVIVFSEPIDETRLTAASVQLLRGTEPVTGRLEFRDPDHLTAAFVPAAPLAAGTAYTLAVTQGIRDLDGQALEAPVSVDFTTASQVASGAVASITVTPDAVTMVPGLVMIRAIVRDANGNEISSPVSWQSSDPTVAVVLYAEYGEQLVDVSGRAAGSATITASAGGRSGAVTVSVGYVSFADVAVGPSGYHCFLTPARAAYCWGRNQWGELGYGLAAVGVYSPVAVAGGLAFTAISTGHNHTCALTTTGTAYCWGANYSGQLGTANIVGPCNPEDPVSCSHTPVAVSGGLMFAEISAGAEHTCGRTADGAAYCWGSNAEGQLGNGTLSGSPTPVAVTGGLTFTRISAGTYDTCGLTPSRIAYCWGSNRYGQLGDGTTTDRLTPVAVHGGLAFTQIAPGGPHSCGLATGGMAYCWGSNYLGELGDGTSSDSPTPVAVTGGVAFSRIAAGWGGACALATGGEAYCWGWTGGLDAEDDYVVVREPTRISGSLSFESLDTHAGGWGVRSCGRATDGLVYCWDGLGNPYRVPGQR